MGRKRLTTEERHSKQKEKLTKANELVDYKNEYVAKPNLKELVSLAAQKKGFNCFIKDSVLLFFDSTEYSREDVVQWLKDNYKKEEFLLNPLEKDKLISTWNIPFSYGFCSPTKEKFREDIILE